MSYDVTIGPKNFHLTWNYNTKIIVPILGDTLRKFNNKPGYEAAEGIATIILELNRQLSNSHSKDATKNGPFGEGGMGPFMAKYGNDSYGHVLEGVLRLTEIMIECYRHPHAVFTIH